LNSLTIIGSTHSECEQTNAENLLKILIKLEPDLIFEEIPETLFNDIYENKRDDDGVEVTAVKKYLLLKKIKHVPIDLPYLNDISLKLKLPEYEDILENEIIKDNIHTSNYCKKIHKMVFKIEEIETQGYMKINNKKFIKLIVKKYNLLNKFFEKEMKEKYHLYKFEHEYDFEMRENYFVNKIIENKENFSKGVLLIGCEHLPTIYKKLRKTRTDIEVKIYDGFA
jgi:hypothetical protein